ncbi:DDE-type integrase/transposase/recombinase [Cupriavidus sp. WGtm5]|uniref:integrase catalytic domain-containing protein n=1 Tax=Cupriavidus sp. WGtm5 TaxID=2919926 RepID=UPI00209194C5|nr:DDE-type integrase/transposase/recombinase [Cupriavidus sp. WGtm5]MCO4887848.1 DDE-type integrase/transposase/recombinase [Cupriavidus sp. WGtm5]
MSRSVLVESMAGELAKAMEYENDENIIAYFSQPPEIQVDYIDKNGKRHGTGPYHPDFLVVTKMSVYVDEVRDDARLYAQTLSHPDSYFRDEEGAFHFLPAEQIFKKMGVPYKIVKNSSINTRLLNNARFLKDYLREDAPPIPSDTLQQITEILEERKYVSYTELLEQYRISADHIFSAIAGGYVDVNLNVEKLDVPSDLIICRDAAISTAVRAARQKELQPVLPLPGVMRLRSGTVIRYDNVEYTVVMCGERQLHVQDKDGYISVLELEAVLALNELNAVSSNAPGIPADPKKTLHDFSSAQWARAETRLNALDNWDLKAFSRSSLESFKRKVRGMKSQLDKLIALMDNIPNRGNFYPHFTNASENKCFIDAIKSYNSPERMTKRGAYGTYTKLIDHHIKEHGEPLTRRSYATFCKNCRDAEDILRREGLKAAYQKYPIDSLFAQSFPVHGTRPHEVCYIDHTTIPLDTRDVEGVDLSKPYITLAVDGTTRHRRAFWLSYNPPSAASVLMVLRDYVRRHKRLPTIIVVDNGKEFHSHELIFFCYLYGIELRYRPPGQPRAGAIVERAFGAMQEEVIQQLRGNTTNMVDPRMVSRSVNPFDRGVWTLPALYFMLDEYFSQYADRAHPALGMSPNEKERRQFRESGLREHTLVRFDENLMLLTCPHAKKWFQLVDNRRGIYIYGQFYWHESFKKLEKGTRLEVRVEPWDGNVLYVCVEKLGWQCAIIRNLEPYRGKTNYQIQQMCRESARAKSQLAKQAIGSGKVLTEKAELFIPGPFDDRMTRQQAEMGHLAKRLGMSIASSQAAKFLEKTTADHINSPFGNLDWGKEKDAAGETDSETRSDGTEMPEDERERSVPHPQVNEATLNAFRSYV